MSSKEIVMRIVGKHYTRISPQQAGSCEGSQMFWGQWWAPMWGCDTLDHLMDEVEYELDKLKEVKP